MDDSIKQALIDRFRGYLDTVAEGEEPPDDPGETADLFSVLVEMAALRSEVRTESRLVKEALEHNPPYGSQVRFESGGATAGWNAPAFAPCAWVNAVSGETFPPAAPPFRRAGAFCGIGNPQSFRRTLTHLGVEPAGVGCRYVRELFQTEHTEVAQRHRELHVEPKQGEEFIAARKR